ncbi:hypothetical protein [Ensifer sp. 4252]|uniref:hypothetical protein n=1 Tax=Ensifer sp. 4252 TaxID=3373915 RepID=UPI003D1ED578
MAAGRAGLFGQRQEEAEEGFIFAAAEAPETLQAPKLTDFLYGATGSGRDFREMSVLRLQAPKCQFGS